MKRFWLAVLILFCSLNVQAQEPIPAKAPPETAGRPTLTLDPGGHTAPIRVVLFTPDSKRLITVAHDNTIRIWDTSSGTCQHTWRFPAREESLGAAALCSKGSTLAVAGAGYAQGKVREVPIYLINLADGRMEKILKGHNQAVSRLIATPDGQLLASAGDSGSIYLWDATTGKQIRVLPPNKNGKPSNLAFSPDGSRLASTGDGHGLRIWSVADGIELPIAERPLKGGNQIAWSPDGKTIAIGSSQGLYLCNPDGTTRQFVPDTHLPSFTPDSRRLLAINRDKKNPDKDKNRLVLLNSTDGTIGVTFKAPTMGALKGGGPTAVSSDGQLVAVGGGPSHETTLLSTADGTQVKRLVGAGRNSFGVGWSPDGKTVAWGYQPKSSGDLADQAPLEHSFRLDDLEFGSSAKTGQNWENFQRARMILGEAILKGRYGVEPPTVMHGKQNPKVILQSYAWNNCGTLLPGDRAVVGFRWGLNFFDTRSPGKALQSFQGHQGGVMAIAPSPDDRYLLTAGGDMTLAIWKPGSERRLLSLFFAEREWIVWTEEGYYAASPGGERLMGWTLDNGNDKPATFYPAEHFRKSLYRPDIIRRVLEFGSVEKALEAADKDQKKASVRTSVEDVLPPFVLITSPDRSKVDVREPTLDVRFIAKAVGKHPITTVRLLLDGRPYPEAVKTFDPPRAGDLREAWTIKLDPGTHTLAVVAESAVSKSVSESIEVACDPSRGLVRAEDKEKAQKLLPHLYILAVGISEYPEKLKLNYAAKDARALAEVCAKHSKDLYKKVEIKLLTDKDATRKNILGGLTWMRRQMTQNDVGVVFFAGHGGKEADDSLFLFPVDIDPDDLLATGVSGDQLKRSLAGMPGRFVVFLDACHSGGIDGDKRRAAGSLTDDLVRDLATDEVGVIVMCSSTGREYSLESPQVQHGYFTLALVEGLSGKATRGTEGAVYLHHLDAYVTDRVKDLSTGRQHPVTNRANLRSFPISRPPASSKGD